VPLSVNVVASSWFALLMDLGALAVLVVGPCLLAYVLGVVYWPSVTEATTSRNLGFFA